MFKVDASYEGLSFEYLFEDYDKDFNINDMGYLWRDDFSSYQAKFSYKNRNNKRSLFGFTVPYIKRYSMSVTLNNLKIKVVY